MTLLYIMQMKRKIQNKKRMGSQKQMTLYILLENTFLNSCLTITTKINSKLITEFKGNM